MARHGIGLAPAGVAGGWRAQSSHQCPLPRVAPLASFTALQQRPCWISASARVAATDTAINPAAIDAFCLAMIAANGSSGFRGVTPSPNWGEAQEEAQAVRAAMQALRTAAPGAGSYLYESSYDMTDAANRAWGHHVVRLEEIKRRYDPTRLLSVHHGIGSNAG